MRWTERDGGKYEAHCRLVVGADGRRSSVRSQTRIELEVDPPAHLVAGMLVDNVEGMDDKVNVMAREADLIFYSFPQQAGCSRLYLCFPTGQESRFAGADGPKRFLETCRLDCLADVADWPAARPKGPCATFPGEDSRVSRPLVDGVVLIGDAAGYENPLQGQGLSMAMHDVRDVSEALLSTGPSDGGRLRGVRGTPCDPQEAWRSRHTARGLDKRRMRRPGPRRASSSKLVYRG